jgi:hypothetical protein
MPLVDPDTGEVSNVAAGLDTHQVAAGQGSLLDDASNFITKALPLTALTAVNSFANTAVEIGNAFADDNNQTEKLNVANEVGDVDPSDPDSLTAYYNQHQQGLEASGLIVGSLIPGTLGVKALKLAQAGRATSVLTRATNIFAGPAAKLLAGSEAEMAVGDSASLFGSITSDKAKAIAYGFGDQALQGLAYEVATAATQKASPLTDDESMGDVLDNFIWGTVTAGGVGGVLHGIGTSGILNKMLLNFDMGTKGQEVARRLGLGNFTGGDRSLALFDSLDKMADAETNAPGLAAKKLSLATDSAMLDAKSSLQTLVPKNDPELGNSAFDFVQQIPADRRQDILPRLSGVSRITDIQPDIPLNQQFFVNKISKADVESTKFEDMVTSVPLDAKGLSERYVLKPGSLEPSIGKITDTFENPVTGEDVLSYPTTQAAWDAGHDMFVNKDGQILVNPNAPNITQIPRQGESRALTQDEELARVKSGTLPADLKGSAYGTATQVRPPNTIANVKTGQITETAIPVVGDYGPGKPTLVSTGLKYGDQISTQNLTNPITAETPTIDANGRYVWANQRGIKSGDQIISNDIPMLEQMYKRGVSGSPDAKGMPLSFSDQMQRLQNMKVGFTDGTPLPSSADELLGKIRTAKDQLLSDTAGADSKLSADDLALRANVTSDYIANGGQATKQADFMVDPKGYEDVNHVNLTYNIGNISQPDGQILRGMLDLEYRVGVVKDSLGAAGQQLFGQNWQDFVSTKGSKDANILGANGSFLGQSNAGYGTLAQEMERIGMVLGKFTQNRMAEIARQLLPSYNAIRGDQTASAELGNFIAARQRGSESYSFIPQDLAAKYGIDPNTAVLSNSLVTDRLGNVTDWNKNYVPAGYVDGSKAGTGEMGNYSYHTLSPKVADFERAQQAVNDTRLQARNNWYLSQGLQKNIKLGTLYTPPVDTSTAKFFAYVKGRPGTALSDDSVSIITARTQDELQTIIGSLSPDLSAFTKDMGKAYHQAEGDYQFTRNFSQNTVESSLKRQGVLNNILPDTRAETILKKYVDWNSRQELSLARDHVESLNGQLFAELDAMGQRFTGTATSTSGGVSSIQRSSAINPYDSYLKTALGISNADNYPLFKYGQERLNAFADTAFNAVRNAFGAAKQGLISYEDASAVSSKFGLGNPYEKMVDGLKAYTEIANQLPNPRILNKFVAAANATLGASVIRLDMWQQLIHMTATPIMLMAELTSANHNVANLLSTELPDGSGRRIPSLTKILFNSVSNIFDAPTRAKYGPMYENAGANHDMINSNMQALDAWTLPMGSKIADSAILQKIQAGVDLGAKMSGSDWSRQFLHWMVADSGRQLFEAKGYTGQELSDNIRTFANRVQGNYIASQRPVAFQGPVGQALGLFQTYQMNLMQQLFRYVEAGEGKTLATFGALQSTLFGASSLPGFQMINNHIVGNAAGNTGHADAYSTVPDEFGNTLGKYLMYGAVSNVFNAGLYSRGDINPRNITLLPINPLNYPAISGGIKFLGSVMDTEQRIQQGGSVPASILLGLEHNGLSRPLAGLAQYVQGFSTTDKGDVISVATRPQDGTMGLSDFFSAANMGRILGARPLDEAIAMDRTYRSTLYTAKNTARMNSLGEAAKSATAGDQELTPDQVSNFAQRYAAIGGDINHFGQSLMRWTQDSRASVANKVFNSLASNQNKQAMRIMGGIPLPDYTNPAYGPQTQQSEESSPTEQTPSLATAGQ